MSIKENILKIRHNLPLGVHLVCVSKYHTEQDILEAYKAGERDFGESRAQELERKALSLPKDIRWHFIGHLQRNKVKQVCRHASLIQSIDSMRLLEEIEKTIDTPIEVLLEVHVAQEETKTGFAKDDLFSLLNLLKNKPLQKVHICGLMGMASLTDNEQQVKQEFAQLKNLFESTKEQFFASDDGFRILSMGMSGDYELAIAEGSTMVRIGSKIFAQNE